MSNVTPLNPQAINEEESEFDVLEGFRSIYGSADEIKDRWEKIIQRKEKNGEKVAADVLRIVAGDLLPLIQELTENTAVAIEDMQEELEQETEGTLTEDEVKQLALTAFSSLTAFQKLAEALPPEQAAGVAPLIDLNEKALVLLRDNFGDDVVDAAIRGDLADLHEEATDEEESDGEE